MSMTKEEAKKKLADAYYGEDAAIGDGTFLEMLLKFLTTFLAGCPLGARRAHAMVNGGPFRRQRAENIIEYAAYEWTSGDLDETRKIAAASIKAGEASTEAEFVDMASFKF